MTLPVYEIRSLKHDYAGKTALEIEHLAIQPSSIVGLIGPNGSGKSTLLKLLALMEKPTQGHILFNGRPVEPFSEHARFLITLLPQEPILMKRNVFKNVSYGLKLRGNEPGHERAYRVSTALSRVGLDGKGFIHRPWYALSGGEAQRVALAARLALEPKVLLMDEPTASVDAGSAQLIKEASLRARRELGTTLVIASHDWQWLYEICDEVLHLFKGKIFGTGRETIIFGPWKELEPDRWGKLLSDGQQIRVPQPPEPETAAVIDVSATGDAVAYPAGERHALRGTVSRISLERKTDRLFATILVADVPFTIKLSPQKNRQTAMFPGNTITIHYRLDRVKWV